MPLNDTLKVNIGLNATYTTEIKNALPILILPYWDNANIARYGIPGQDGVMCTFLLYNKYVGGSDFYQVTLVNQTSHDRQTFYGR